MNCQKCGAPLLDSDRFCTECGAKVVYADTGAANTANMTGMSQIVGPVVETIEQNRPVVNKQDSVTKVLAGLMVICSFAYIVGSLISIQYMIDGGEWADITGGQIAVTDIMILVIGILFFTIRKNINKAPAVIGMIISVINFIYCLACLFGYSSLAWEIRMRYPYNDIEQFWQMESLLALILIVLSVITFLKVKK